MTDNQIDRLARQVGTSRAWITRALRTKQKQTGRMRGRIAAVISLRRAQVLGLEEEWWVMLRMKQMKHSIERRLTDFGTLELHRRTRGATRWFQKARVR